jgi:hypothetical protein
MTPAKPNEAIINTSDGEPLAIRAQKLGVRLPEGVCVLPDGFFGADKASDLTYPSAALDVKALFREAGLPVGLLEGDGVKIPYTENRFDTWVGPALAFGAGLVARNPEIVKSAVVAIAGYVKSAFQTVAGLKKVKLSVVVEDGDGKSHKTDFEGPVEELPKILSMIKTQNKQHPATEPPPKTAADRAKTRSKAKGAEKRKRKKADKKKSKRRSK